MKTVLLLLLLPLFSFSQTVHREGKKIVYTGDVSVAAHAVPGVLSMLKDAMHTVIKNGKHSADQVQVGDTLSANGEMDLKVMKSVSRKLHYSIRLQAKEDGYAYTIDSVYVTERKFGEKEKTKKDKDLFADMDVSGPTSVAAEKILNEIDMNLQKLLAMLEKEMKKGFSAN